MCLVPYASMLDPESSNAAKTVHSTSPAAISVNLPDLRNSRYLHWLSSAAEHPDLSTKSELRQPLHSPYCMWVSSPRNGLRIQRQSVQAASQHQTPCHVESVGRVRLGFQSLQLNCQVAHWCAEAYVCGVTGPGV
jgi:hypothetical protein